MKVYLAEKPKVGKILAEVLGISKISQRHIDLNNGDVVTWAVGHLLTLSEPNEMDEKWASRSIENLPIFPDKYSMKVKSNVIDQFQTVKLLIMAPNCSEVVIATDSDREGELIAREILDFCNYKKNISRLWFSSLTVDALSDAIKKPLKSDETIGLYYSALNRQRADWLVGMNLSRALAAKVNCMDISAGRVQSPTLSMIVQRDLAIDSFQPKTFYSFTGSFKTEHDIELGMAFLPKDENCISSATNATELAKMIENKVGLLSSEKVKKSTPPPQMFYLSTLQQEMNKRYQWGAAYTLEMAQLLYEQKFITYPRTDCPFLPSDMVKDVQPLIHFFMEQSLFHGTIKKEQISPRKSIYNDKEITAHHAIIPCLGSNPATLKKDELLLLQTIVARYIIAHLDDYVYDATTISWTLNKVIIFKAHAIVPVKLGWKENFSEQEDDNDDSEDIQILPEIKNGTKALAIKISPQKKQTKAPLRYSEGTLLYDMEHAGKFLTNSEDKVMLSTGIGTEATRANIIQSLLTKKYIFIEKNKIFSTKKGKGFISLCKRLSPFLINVDETALWERCIMEIETQKKDNPEFLIKIKDKIKESLLSINQSMLTEQEVIEIGGGSVGICPECGGMVVEKPYNYICVPQTKNGILKYCNFNVQKEQKFLCLSLSRAEVEVLLKNGKVKLSAKSKQGKTYTSLFALKKTDATNGKTYWNLECLGNK